MCCVVLYVLFCHGCVVFCLDVLCCAINVLCFVLPFCFMCSAVLCSVLCRGLFHPVCYAVLSFLAFASV